jgi:hypothetical protein
MGRETYPVNKTRHGLCALHLVFKGERRHVERRRQRSQLIHENPGIDIGLRNPTAIDNAHPRSTILNQF